MQHIALIFIHSWKKYFGSCNQKSNPGQQT